jgi:HSP20 family protein
MSTKEKEKESAAGPDDKSLTERAAGLWPLAQLRKEIDRLFDESENGFWRRPFGQALFGAEDFWRSTSAGTALAVDISETNGAYEITAELPGLKGKDVDVKLVQNVLTIKGEKTEEKKKEKKDYHLSERRYGAFQRSFRLPEHVDSDKISAEFKNGVLKIVAPKSPEAAKEERSIEIKSG